MRVFLDTNIVLDVLLNRPTLAADSEAVILRCEAVGAEMFISWHGLATAYYLLKRGRTEREALAEVDKILAWARVAATSDASARRGSTRARRSRWSRRSRCNSELATQASHLAFRP